MAARVEWVTDPARFAALAEEWDALAEARGLPFVRHAWVTAWWSAFGGTRKLRVCVVRDGGELAAAFPLGVSGGRLSALADLEHTPVFVPLARDAAALDALLRAVVAAPGGELVAYALPADDPALCALADASRAAGRLTLVEAQHVSPIVETGGDFDSYRRGLDRRRRQDVERRRRRLEDEHETSISVAAPADLDAELDEAFALEARGWKGRRGTAIGQAEQTRTFYDAVARGFHAQGRLRLARLRVDGRLGAFDLALLDHGRLWVLKGAYDEELARFAPGLVVTYAEARWCFDEGLDGLELLGDDEPWKRTFANAERRHCVLRSYRLRPAPAGRFAYRRAVRPLLRRAYRTVRPVRRGRA